jgi:hypothetical protein
MGCYGAKDWTRVAFCDHLISKVVDEITVVVDSIGSCRTDRVVGVCVDRDRQMG